MIKMIKRIYTIILNRASIIKTVYYNFEFVQDNEFEQFKNINKICIYLYDNYNQKILFEKEIKL